MLFMSCVVMLSRLFIAALWSSACWERADILALVYVFIVIFFYFPIWYPGSGAVLDCIDS